MKFLVILSIILLSAGCAARQPMTDQERAAFLQYMGNGGARPYQLPPPPQLQALPQSHSVTCSTQSYGNTAQTVCN